MKKNIDHLFQEKLKNFHETPDEKVWENIEASLNKKKNKRRILPIWWQLGGVAALLAILLYVVNPFSSVKDTTPVITNIENTTVPYIRENDSLNDKNNTIIKQAEEEVAITNPTEDNKKSTKNTLQKKSIQLAETKAIKGATSKIKDKVKNAVNLSKEIASTNSEKQKKNNTEVPVYKTNDAVLTLEKGTNITNNIKSNNTNKGVITSNNSNKENLTTSNTVKEIAEIGKQKETTKKSIFEEIEKINEEETTTKSTSKKWSMGASIAPVYFDGLGSGSPIDNSFANNTKSGNVNLSYGLVVAYDISKKLSIKSGIHKVDYGYDTNDVSFSPSLDASSNTLSNIDQSKTSKNIILENSSVKSSFSVLDTNAKVVNLEGNMLQQFGYIEVPLELNYALIDRKFGIHIIGGVSSLFLVDNTVLLESEGLSTKIGEANNINNINFSTNVGLGLHYKFSPKIKLNIEPVFKYQLDTFSKTDSDFRPYSVGVYSGFSIKF